MKKYLCLLRDRATFWWWYLTEYKPIAGADDDPDPDPAPDPDPDPAPDPKPDPDPTPDDTVTMPKGEAERLRREVAKAAQEKRDRERKDAEAKGEHEKVVKQTEQERDEAQRERDEARAEQAKTVNEGNVRKVAGNLDFHDAEDAVLRTPSEVAEKGEAAIEKHLREVAKKSPHLVGKGKSRSSASLPDDGGKDVEQLANTDGMSTDEIAKALEEGRLRDYMKSK